jgi:hypothetical protein
MVGAAARGLLRALTFVEAAPSWTLRFRVPAILTKMTGQEEMRSGMQSIPTDLLRSVLISIHHQERGHFCNSSASAISNWGTPD